MRRGPRRLAARARARPVLKLAGAKCKCCGLPMVYFHPGPYRPIGSSTFRSGDSDQLPPRSRSPISQPKGNKSPCQREIHERTQLTALVSIKTPNSNTRISMILPLKRSISPRKGSIRKSARRRRQNRLHLTNRYSRLANTYSRKIWHCPD